MSTKRIFPCALVLAVLGFGVARAQEMLPASQSPQSSQGPATTPAEALPAPHGPTGPSDWMTYTRPDCCGPLGANGPILMEVYMRSGVSLPAEGKVFGHVLETGWVIEGGGRSLFFNPQMDAAWSVDLSLSNVWNHGQRSDISVPYHLQFPNATGTGSTTVTPNVTIHNLNRTFVNASFGHEWYIWRAGNGCNDAHWRWGMDAGGRLGSVKIEFNEILHHNDVAGGMFVALHTDLEVPCGCCTFLAGFRVEWDYTWMDILQSQNNSDMEDVNFLITAGIRF
jgi:hypothetical protein